MLGSGRPDESTPEMNRLSTTAWEIGAGLACAALLGTGAYLFATRKRPTAEELEQARRKFLVEAGRIVDGMLLDAHEIQATDGRTLTMLLFSYRIGGVDYECSQDITALRNVVDLQQVRAGFPCSVRYQPGSPQNSIVFAEDWTGMRMGLPALPPLADTEAGDRKPLRAGGSRPPAQA
jgi:hypothetical protein